MKSTVFRTLILLLTGFLFLSVPVYALDYTTKITGITMQPDFWAGMLPSAVSYMYQLTGIELIPGKTTEMGLELETGTLARKFKRDPLTGRLLSSYYSSAVRDIADEAVSESESDSDVFYLIEHPDYDTMYAGFNFIIRQQLFVSSSGTDTFTVSTGLKGRWEASINPILPFGTRNGTPFDKYASFSENRFLPGTPDLSGNRQLFDVAFSFSGVLDGIRRKLPLINGAKVSFEFLYSPAYSNTSSEVGGKSEFIKFLFNLSESVVLYEKKDSSENNVFSIGLSNAMAFRYLTGKYVPAYAESLNLPVGWYIPENSTYLIEDVLKFDYYGKQFFKYFIPRASVFFNVSYNWGKLNNTVERQSINTLCASVGLRLEMLIGSHYSFYYEIGRIFAYTGQDSAYYLGFVSSNTIKINVSVDF